jgi:hypothetical protein
MARPLSMSMTAMMEMLCSFSPRWRSPRGIRSVPVEFRGPTKLEGGTAKVASGKSYGRRGGLAVGLGWGAAERIARARESL